jgi:hypothetical protein
VESVKVQLDQRRSDPHPAEEADRFDPAPQQQARQDDGEPENDDIGQAVADGLSQ